MRLPQHLVVLHSDSNSDGARARDLKNVLKVLVDKGDVSLWSRRDVAPGMLVRDAVSANFAKADVFVVLLSADFLAAEQADLEKVFQAQAYAAAVFVLLRPCGWQYTKLSGEDGEDDSKIVPRRDGRAAPVTSFSDAADAWQQVLAEVASVVKRRASSS